MMWGIGEAADSIAHCQRQSKGYSRRGGGDSEFQVSLGAGKAIGSDTKTKPAQPLTLESPRRQILPPLLDFRRENAIVGKSLQLPAVRVR